MFAGSSSLTELNIKNFNTTKAYNMNSMLRSCSSLKTLDLSHFQFSKDSHLDYMLADCSSLKLLFLPKAASAFSPNNFLYRTDAKVIYK